MDNQTLNYDGLFNLGGKPMNYEIITSSNTIAIKYANGLLLCAGRTSFAATTAITAKADVVFPVPFKDTGYYLCQTCKEMEVLLRLTGREMLVETIYVQQQKPVFLTRKQMEIMELPTTGLQ